MHGEGEDYLLQIGGAGFAHENFGFVTDKMTPHFKVIEFDLRGYGLSDPPEQEFDGDLGQTTSRASSTRSASSARTCHGTSMGGMSRSRSPAATRAGRRPRARLRFREVRHHGARALGGLEAARAGLRDGGEPLALEIATKCLSARLPRQAARPETVRAIRRATVERGSNT